MCRGVGVRGKGGEYFPIRQRFVAPMLMTASPKWSARRISM